MSQPALQQMPRETHVREDAPRAAETRACARLPVHSLAYIELSDENAGLILNISETGISVQAVQTLNSNHFPHMRFRLPGTEISVEVAGRIVWQIKSKKEAGIEFVNPPSKVRAQIGQWIAEEPLRVAAAMARAGAITEPAAERSGSSRSANAKSDSSHEVLPADPTAPLMPVPPRVAAPPPHRPVRIAGSPPHPQLIPSVEDPDWISKRPRDLRNPSPSSEFGNDRSFADQQRLPERAPAMPQWKGYMAPGVGMEFKKPRRWWTYTAALGFIAALGFAALMMFNPDAITRARIEALTHQTSTTQNDSQPINPDGSTNTSAPTKANPSAAAPSPNPNSSAASNTTSKSATTSSPAGSNPISPPERQPPFPDDAGSTPSSNLAGPSMTQNQGTLSGAQRNSSQEKQRNSALPTRRAEQYASRDQRQSSHVSQAPANSYYKASQPAYGQHGKSASSSLAANATGAYPSQSQSTQSLPSKSAATNLPSNPPAANSTATNTSRPQPSSTNPYNSASQPGASTPAERTQPSPPPASNYPSNSSTAPTNQRPVQQRDQDAYARSSNNLPAASSTASRPVSQPRISSIEVPGSQSYPVPPSVPLVGVPSGLVGATSQFHAIRVPSELQPRTSQLAGNLQIGQLISSYSPAYPIGAAREGIEGTVKLDVIVGRDGTVRSVQVLSGPPMLASSAANAVRDWRYGETFLSGQAIETEQYVTIVFRLAK